MARKDRLLVKLGAVLRKIREERGYSQDSFAAECGLHRTYIGAVERGEYNVTLLTLRTITASLGVSLTDVIEAAER